MLEGKRAWSGRLSRSAPWGHRRRHRRSQRSVQNDEVNNGHILCLSLFIIPKDGIKNKKLRAGTGRSRRKGGSWFCCCFGHSKHSKSFVRPVKSISSDEHVVIKMKTQKTPQQNRVLLVTSPLLVSSDSGSGDGGCGKRETWSVVEIAFQRFSCLQAVSYSWDALKAWSSNTQGKQFTSWTN